MVGADARVWRRTVSIVFDGPGVRETALVVVIGKRDMATVDQASIVARRKADAASRLVQSTPVAVVGAPTCRRHGILRPNLPSLADQTDPTGLGGGGARAHFTGNCRA